MTTRRTGWAEDERLLFVLIAALLAMSAIIVAVAGTGIDGTRMLIRATARSSLLIFLAAFAASSLARLWPAPTTRWMIRNRRWLGLGFAFSHLVHLIAILWLFGVYGGETPPPPMRTIIGGGIAYVFIALLAATSWNGAVRALGARNWQRLHKAGVWYIWLIFMVSYGGRAAINPLYLPPAMLLVGAAALRLVASRRRAAA
ncbi:ferric reductase-like transmembrane domain-containing protein [Sphingopyxis sp. BSN-002]|uniref:ferric reductase-like transmembrane domain-containing protein n=1 Tax=Sphingopyxis sp. BSN-002 TaxID=2911495 RepID=UPI001EDAB3CF|nr:ferric reductase-like transmembrane domain-containing protein [Sphingopyxis sp. BSN-002]UKK84052.1 ferric reductase-like transmembrane domain-containing protein [Sphingopyxis sp. BSN-002]